MGELGLATLIDWAQLDRLCHECGAEVRPIFQDFIADSLAESAQFHQWTDPSQCTEISNLAHKLKGSSSTFGLSKFSALLKKIELNADAGRVPTAVDLSEIERIFKESIALIQRERPELTQI